MRVFTDLSQLPTFQNAVITIGSFDGVHLGHRQILDKLLSLAKECHGETVVITFDPHPRAVLQPKDTSFKLISTTAEKIKLLEDIGIHNVVVVPFSIEFSIPGDPQKAPSYSASRPSSQTFPIREIALGAFPSNNSIFTT